MERTVECRGLEGGGPMQAQLHVDLSEHQRQHTIERSSGNLRFENHFEIG